MATRVIAQPRAAARTIGFGREALVAQRLLIAIPAAWAVAGHLLFFWAWWSLGEQPGQRTTWWTAGPAPRDVLPSSALWLLAALQILLHVILLVWPVVLLAWLTISDIARRASPVRQWSSHLVFLGAVAVVAISTTLDPLGAVRWLFE